MADKDFVRAQSDNLPNIDAFMLMEYMKNNECYSAEEIRGVKADLSMRSSYVDSAIGYVQVKRNGTSCTLLAQICPEHKIRAKNYKVMIVVCEEKETIEEVKCLDCAASEGGCKHSLAFLMWAHKKSTQPAPTEVECYWKKPKLGADVAVTTADFGVVSEANLESADNFLQNTLQHLTDTSDSQITKFFQRTNGRKQLSLHILIHEFASNINVDKSGENFIEFCKSVMTNNLCQDAEKQTVNQSANKLWFELRYGRITGSKIYSAARCKTTDGVFVKTVIGASKMFQTKAMHRGLKLEDNVRKIVAEKLNLKIKDCGLVLNKAYPEFGASPDGVTKEAVIEIKCPSSTKTVSNYILQNNEISSSCKAQIHLQMLMLHVKKGYLCIADPNFEVNKEVKIIEVNYNEEYFNTILAQARKFWLQAIYPRLLESVL